jgi:iron complex transport system ATP-binding protein
MTEGKKILAFDSLGIGFKTGRVKRLLLPPLTESAFSGELIAVIGRNGIGKSTLLRTLAGIQNPLEGEVYYNGTSLSAMSRSDLATIVSFTSTEILKITNMTVYDLVSLGRFPYTNWFGSLSREDDEMISDALEKTSLKGFAGRFVSELSDGERQKTMIARMLAQDTSVMLMDEPTAFLDIRSKFEILNLMRNLSHNEGKTIIFTTHDLSMALSHADKIWLTLDSGMKDGSPEDLMMRGDFDHLFDSSYVDFDGMNGTYSLHTEDKGTLFVKGEGRKLHWSREAIKRAGYSVTDKETENFIEIRNDRWILCYEGNTYEFLSIYELVKGLASINRQSI